MVCVPAVAQTARRDQPASTAKSWTPSRTPDGQPDLEGVWADTRMTPLERPKALAGREFLTGEEVARLRQRAARYFGSASNDFIAGDNLFLMLLADFEIARNPNATGNALGMIAREIDNRTSLITDPPDGRLPPLTPAGLRRQAALQASNLVIPFQPGVDLAPTERRLPASPEDLSNTLRCITWGVPKIAGNANYLSHYQIVQAPGYVVLLSEVNHEARIIPLDERAPLPSRLVQWNGDSRGRWEGTTLVVETTNFSPRSNFRGAADGLHLIERFTRTAADSLDYQITVSDPTTWTEPWTALVRLRRTDDRLYESACHEGNYVVIEGILGAARADEDAARQAR
jgi:hypothetical protein